MERFCARCGAVRHSALGVCPTCGLDTLTAPTNTSASDTAGFLPAYPPEHCPHCGAEHSWQTQVCARCGRRVFAACPSCGAANATGNRRCIYCGAGLDAAQSEEPASGDSILPDRLRATDAIAKANALWVAIRSPLDFTVGSWEPPASPNTRRIIEIAAVALLMLAGLLVRVWNIGSVPAAPAGDESAIALETIRVLTGEWHGIWSGAALGNPSGHMYWVAPFFWLGGHTLTMLRLSSALPGVLLIPICYLMVRMFFPFPVAFIAAGFLAFFSWFVIIFRIGIPITLSIFFAAASICLVCYAVRRSRLWAAVAAGLALGLGLHVFKGYAIYFAAIWGATLLALLASARLRRDWAPYLFLGVSLIAGVLMLQFYLSTNYLNTNLQSQYAVAASDLLSVPSHIRRMLEILSYVNVPPHLGGFGFDGIIPGPLLHPLISVFFWLGLLTTLMFCNRRPFQLLLLGWLIGMAPAVLVPGGETRRYLLGVFFVFVVTGVGFAAMLHLAMSNWPTRWRLDPTRRWGLSIGWVRFAAVGLAGILLLGAFAADNLSAFSDWTDGQEMKFQFDPEIAVAARYMDSLDGDHDLRFYSVRWSVDYETVRWFAPSVHGTNGSAEFGGDGTIFSDGVVEAPTVFMLLGGYLHLITALETTYPGGTTHREADAGGRTQFISYTIDNPPAPGTVDVPPYYRLSPNPASTIVRVGDVASFQLDTNQIGRVAVVIATAESGSPVFVAPEAGCDGLSVYSIEIQGGDTFGIRACQPGVAELAIHRADTGDLVNRYLIEARETGERTDGRPSDIPTRIEPDPTLLVIRARPYEHHQMELVGDQSALIIPRPPDGLIIHNNPDLQDSDGCEAVDKRPEGDTRLSLIWPEEGEENRSLFYVVGCAPGPAVLDVIIDGSLDRSYRFEIGEP